MAVSYPLSVLLHFPYSLLLSLSHKVKAIYTILVPWSTMEETRGQKEGWKVWGSHSWGLSVMPMGGCRVDPTLKLCVIAMKYRASPLLNELLPFTHSLALSSSWQWYIRGYDTLNLISCEMKICAARPHSRWHFVIEEIQLPTQTTTQTEQEKIISGA